MKHGLSEAEKAWRSRPLAHTGRFWAAAAVACVVVPYYLWQLEPRAVLGFVPYLVVAAGIGLLVVVIRRTLGLSRSHLDQTFIEVTPGGIWCVTSGSRSLLLAAPQIQRLCVFRSPLKILVRVVIESGDASATFTGLHDMQAFLSDVVTTFERCVVADGEETIKLHDLSHTSGIAAQKERKHGESEVN